MAHEYDKSRYDKMKFLDIDGVIWEIENAMLHGQKYPLPAARILLRRLMDKHGVRAAQEVIDYLELEKEYPGEDLLP